MIIDTHCHLDDKRYDEDLKEVIERAKNDGVRGFLLPGANLEDLPKAKEISYKFDEVFYAAGVHPYHHEQYDEKILREYLKDSRCIAVGECGLDYYRLPKDEDEKIAEKRLQKKVFEAQINLAIEFQKPLIVHVREASKDSFNMLSSLAAGKVCGGVLHCYNASEIFLSLSDDNFYFGIGGVLTFKNEKKLGKILSRIPLDRLLLETDSPYLTPHPYRGERNEPVFTKLVVKKMAEILNIDAKTLIDQTTNNAKRLFKAFEKLD